MLYLVLLLMLLSGGVQVLSGAPQSPTVAKVKIVGEDLVLSKDGRQVLLGSGARYRDIWTSPTGDSVLFVREPKANRTSTSGDRGPLPEVWIATAADGWKSRLVVDMVLSPDSQKVELRGFREPQLSWDGSDIYVLVDDFSSVTYGLYKIPASGRGSAKFVTSALSYWLVRYGAFRGNIIVKQNRSLLPVGRIEMFYMYKPDGKEFGFMGLEEKAILEFLSDEEAMYRSNGK